MRLCSESGFGFVKVFNASMAKVMYICCFQSASTFFTFILLHLGYSFSGSKLIPFFFFNLIFFIFKITECVFYRRLTLLALHVSDMFIVLTSNMCLLYCMSLSRFSLFYIPP